MKQNELAEFYKVTVKTIQRWKKLDAPLDNPQRMVGWMLSRQRVPEGAKLWLEKMQKEKAACTLPIDAEPSDFDEPDSDSGELKDLEERRIELDRKLDLAMKKNDHGQIKLYGELLVKVDESLRRDEAHQKKLGLDRGEVLGRDEVVRILRAVSHAGNACINAMLKEICQRVVSFDYPEEAYHFLKPVLLGGRLFAGFAQVEKVPGPPNVPAWVSEAIRAEAEQYLDNPELIWEWAAGEGCDTKILSSSTDGE